MSEPKPWDLWEVILEETDSKWVRWEDYARLKAEVERLTAFTTRTIIPNEELQAQVERLTKAGDAMEDAVIDNGLERMNEARDGWNAAKEGKNL
jgi:hypothetical protein